MDLNEITNRLSKVSDIYADKFNVRRGDDWFVLKIQEELGELSAAHLKATQRARIGDTSQADLNKNPQDEIADVVSMTPLIARHRGIDIQKN